MMVWVVMPRNVFNPEKESKCRQSVLTVYQLCSKSLEKKSTGCKRTYSFDRCCNYGLANLHSLYKYECIFCGKEFESQTNERKSRVCQKAIFRHAIVVMITIAVITSVGRRILKNL